MENPTEEVYICILDGLFLEEIVGHEFYSFSESWKDVLGGSFNDWWNVLDNEGKVWEDFRQMGTSRTM